MKIKYRSVFSRSLGEFSNEFHDDLCVLHVTTKGGFMEQYGASTLVDCDVITTSTYIIVKPNNDIFFDTDRNITIIPIIMKGTRSVCAYTIDKLLKLSNRHPERKLYTGDILSESVEIEMGGVINSITSNILSIERLKKQLGNLKKYKVTKFTDVGEFTNGFISDEINAVLVNDAGNITVSISDGITSVYVDNETLPINGESQIALVDHLVSRDYKDYFNLIDLLIDEVDDEGDYYE